MPALTGTAYPPPLTDTEAERLVVAIQDWSSSHGLQVRPAPGAFGPTADDRDDGDKAERMAPAIAAPVTVFPSLFPKRCFDEGLEVQTTYNELYAAVSRDEAFIERTVNDVIQGDDFIRNLWEVHQKVKKEGYVQSLSLGLFRSDYMVHEDTQQIKQVEFNTIASSFGCLSYYTGALHNFLAAREYPLLENAIPHGTLDLPPNNSIDGLAAGLAAAVTAYAATPAASSSDHPTCVVFLVRAVERNVFDQRHLEYRLSKHLSPDEDDKVVPVFRLSLADVIAHTTVADTPGRQLLYHHPGGGGSGGGAAGKPFEVAVVYLRAGYGPDDYTDGEAAWRARYWLERSAAIKCPSVLTQLAGTKKVQQVLATPELGSGGESSGMRYPVLERFVAGLADDGGGGDKAGEKRAAMLSRTFTNMFPMDTSSAGMEARARALDPRTAAGYVLKPQREGGGNNVYGAAIPAFLAAAAAAASTTSTATAAAAAVDDRSWSSYVLMELIAPPPSRNLILRAGTLVRDDVVAELGVYGACLWDHATGEVRYNRQAGYLLRTKPASSGEGGVDAGFGCLDSCSLV